MKIFSIKMERKISLLNYLVLTRISYGGLGYVEERERGERTNNDSNNSLITNF